MNYEEKYKSALEWMRSIYPTMQGADKEDAEHYFPELKESEDERIRKGLIKGLSAMRDIHKHQTFSDDAINIDDAIAWLEKQGNQDALKELPKWKKVTEHKLFNHYICVMTNSSSPTIFLEKEIHIGDYYIDLEDLKTLPKEE